MAHATARTYQPAPVVEGITLELTEREAFVLNTLIYQVAGDPNGPLGDLEAISAALDTAGIGYDPQRGDRGPRQIVRVRGTLDVQPGTLWGGDE